MSFFSVLISIKPVIVSAKHLTQKSNIATVNDSISMPYTWFCFILLYVVSGMWSGVCDTGYYVCPHYAD